MLQLIYGVFINDDFRTPFTAFTASVEMGVELFIVFSLIS